MRANAAITAARCRHAQHLHVAAVGNCRASQLQCELEEHATKLQKAHAQLDRAEHMLSKHETEGSISKAAVEAANREVSSLKGELKAHADAAGKVSHPRQFLMPMPADAQ